jgi:hypothetical protein
MEGKLKGVTCFKCEVLDKHVPADYIVLYMGVETPICKKCYEALKYKVSIISTR